MRATDEMVEAAARAQCASQGGYDPDEKMANDGPRWHYYAPLARAALEAALAVEGTEAQAKPVAFLVDDFHVARSPVKARGKFPEPDHYLYPAKREADARDVAKIMGGTCTPLYTTPPAGIREALERDAARWNALLRCARIEVRGSAGFDPKTGKRRNYDNASRAMVDGAKGWVHFSADFWSEYPGHEDADKKGRWGTVALTALADEVIRKDNEESSAALRGQS